ncbi:MAG: PEP-CTERM sorting domain-containing protein [Methylococcales bacterium]
MKQFKKLILASAVGSLLLSATAANAAATVSYNFANTRAASFTSQDGLSKGPTGWSGVGPNYTGNLPADWYVGFDAAGGKANVTSAGALAAGSQELMVGPKAFADHLTPADGTNNWGHTADFGLFSLTTTSNVTITLSSDNSLIGHTFQDNASAPVDDNGEIIPTPWIGAANTARLAPGFSVWKNWSGAGGSRHAEWDQNGAINPFTNNPLGSDSVTIPETLASGCNVAGAACAFNATRGSSSSISTATLTLLNLAPGNYSIYLGGYLGIAGPTEAANAVAYSATLTAAPVPVPGAVWLFGSALAGFVGRRQFKKA